MVAVSRASPRHVMATTLASIALLIGLGADLYLYLGTMEEGTHYFVHAWNNAPFVMILWFLLFEGWQMLAVVAIFQAKKQKTAGR